MDNIACRNLRRWSELIVSLPILTTAKDVESILTYLRNKPTGATQSEIGAALAKNVVDKRKVAAYVAWDLVTREGDRLMLTSLGWSIARAEGGSASIYYRQVLTQVPPYRSVLEWAHHSNLSHVTSIDIAAHWHQ